MNSPILRPPETAPIPRLALRQHEAAIALGVSVPTLRQWTAAGIVAHVRIGGCLLYGVDELREFLRAESESRQTAESA